MATVSASQHRLRRTVAAALVGLVAALVGLPVAGHAATRSDELRALAAEAAQLIAHEQALLTVIEAFAGDPSQLAIATAELAEVDAAGAAALAELDASGTSVPAAARAALALLPHGPDPAMLSAPGTPGADVYRAAVGDLLGLATRSVAVPGPSVERGGVSFELLTIVALLLVAAGLTILLFTVRGAAPRRELSALAWSDALTGLANRRCLDRDLRELTAGEGATRGRHPVTGPTAVIMVDIDHFKKINDTYGHGFGDDVLRAVGALLNAQVRRGDVVYRYGGEEFCIVLPGTSDRDALRVADRIVGAARRLEFPGGVTVTVSAGVADGSGADVSRTLHVADEALLAAKRAGRDRAAGAAVRV